MYIMPTNMLSYRSLVYSAVEFNARRVKKYPISSPCALPLAMVVVPNLFRGANPSIYAPSYVFFSETG